MRVSVIDQDQYGKDQDEQRNHGKFLGRLPLLYGKRGLAPSGFKIHDCFDFVLCLRDFEMSVVQVASMFISSNQEVQQIFITGSKNTLAKKVAWLGFLCVGSDHITTDFCP